MAFKNTAVVKVIVAWDTVNNVYKTGDSANITTRGVGDGAEFTPAAPNVTEIDSTNLPGRYSVALAAGENNYHTVTLGGKSSTSGIAIFGPQWDNEMNANLVQILATALTETVAGYLAAAFKKVFDVTTPVFTAASVNQTEDNATRLTNLQSRVPAALTGNGNMKSSLVEILTTALTETAGQLAGGFKKFFNIGTPAATMDHLILVDTVTTYTGNTPQSGDAYNRIGAAGVGLSAIPDEAGVTTLLARLTATRAGYLDNLSGGAVALASGVILTSAGQQAVADAFLARNVAGGSNSGRTVSQAIQTLRNKQAIVAGVYTCYATDDTTPLFEANVTTAAGNPMSAWAPTT
jgi:hypothetical protein